MMRIITILSLIFIYSFVSGQDFEYFVSKGAYRISALMLFSEDIDIPIRGVHYLYQGELHFLEGKWNTSLLNYRLFLFLNPLSSYKGRVIFNLGRIYYINNDKERAKYSFSQSSRMGLNDRYAYMSLSYLSALNANEGMLTEADKMYKSLFNDFPEFLHTSIDRYRHSQVQIALGKYEDAIGSLQLIDSSDERFVDSRFCISQLLYHIGEGEKAIETIRSIIKAEGEATEKDKEIMLYCASLMYKNSLKDDARVILERLIETDTEKDDYCTKARLLLSYIEFDSKNFKKVIELWRDVQESVILDNPDISYLLSLVYYRQGLLKEAEYILVKSLNNMPNNERERYLLGWVYFREGRYVDSEATFKNVAEKGGALKDYSKFMVSESIFKQYKYEEALLGFTEILETEVPSQLYYEAMLRIADSKYNKGEIDDAIDMYNKFINSGSPPDGLLARALYSLGKAYNKKGEINKSTSTLESFIRRFPEDENAESVITLILDTLEEKEDHGGIIKFVEINERLFSDKAVHKKMLISKGRAYYKLGLYTQADEVFNELKTNYSNSGEAVEAEYYKYMVEYHLGKYKSPLEASEAFLENNPSSPLSSAIRLIIAKYYIQNSEYDKAENLLLPIIENGADIESAEAGAAMLNTIYVKQGKTAKLGDMYKGLAEKSKTPQDRIKLLMSSAEAYKNAGLTEEAINIYSDIIDEYPEGDHIPKALYNLGLIYKDAGLYQNALLLFEEIISKYKGSEYYAQAVLNLAFVHQHLGNLDKSIEYHKMVIGFKDRSLSVQSTYWLADCYYNIGHREEALRWLDKLERDFKDFPNWIKKGEELRYKITGGK